jgi:hypothetical protein
MKLWKIDRTLTSGDRKNAGREEQPASPENGKGSVAGIAEPPQPPAGQMCRTNRPLTPHPSVRPTQAAPRGEAKVVAFA